jgi:site-specific DNA-methyltransferase (adenine-specific)
VHDIVVANTAPVQMMSADQAEEMATGLDRSDLARKDIELLAEETRWHQQQAELHHKKALFHFVEVGRRLTEAKERLAHGEFMPYLSDEVNLSQRQAWNLMEVARNQQRVADLPTDTSLRGALEVIHEQKQEERSNRLGAPAPEVHLPEGIMCALEVGDAADLPLPDNLADLIVTSPPYGLGIDYAHTDDDQGYATYMEYAQSWGAEMFRIAAPQGRLCLNVPLDVMRGGPKPMAADWLNRLREAGWRYRTCAVWTKGNGNTSKSVARGSVDSPSSPYLQTPVEVVLVMHKNEWNLKRADDHTLTHEHWLEWTNGLWTFPGEFRDRVKHPAPFPEELPRRCIELFSFTSDVVLDPFVGSGTTAVVAHRLGRTFYGFDHSPQYIEVARARLARELTS